MDIFRITYLMFKLLFIGSLSFLVKVYYLNQSLLIVEFGLNKVFQRMLTCVRLGLFFMIFVMLYEMYRYGNYLDNGVTLIGLLFPTTYFLSNENQEEICKYVETFVFKRRIHQFLSCPKCKTGRLFYRPVEGLEDVSCFYLINQNHQQVFVGFVDSENQMAYDFVSYPEQFDEVVNHYYSLLEVSNIDLVVINEETYRLSENCYCNHCQEKINHFKVEMGLVLF